MAHFCSKCGLLGLGESLVVKIFLCKQEDLNSRCRTHVKKSGMTSQACNPSSREVETGGPLGSLVSQPHLIGEPRLVLDVSKASGPPRAWAHTTTILAMHTSSPTGSQWPYSRLPGCSSRAPLLKSQRCTHIFQLSCLLCQHVCIAAIKPALSF